MSVSDVIARRARVAQYGTPIGNESDDWHDMSEHDGIAARDIVGMLDSGFNVATMRRDIGID